MDENLIGYARCSTQGQDLRAQRTALRKLGVDTGSIYTDRGYTGRNRKRPGLTDALAAVEEGDTLVVTKLDRLGRSVADLHAIVGELDAKGARLIYGGQVYNPGDPISRMFFTVLGAMAEFEADLTRARTREGVAIAKAEGRMTGRKPKLTALQHERILEDYESGKYGAAALMDLYGLSRSAVYAALVRARQHRDSPPHDHRQTRTQCGEPRLHEAPQLRSRRSRVPGHHP
ncbi:recombinase family protein [Rhodococcus sp. KRD197]|uniref:recombinase family protein n=1 Tax=Rhodococcus sp. KRD197 TaxID=2729731 RepID=UPI0019D0B1BB|nr:recombinase family protein [Rhodococcus sp. KRD197]